MMHLNDTNIKQMNKSNPVKPVNWGWSAPNLSQIEMQLIVSNIDIEPALLKGFWYLFIFSAKGMNRTGAGKQSIEITPINLDDKIRSILNVVRKYHSGNISKGVTNGLDSWHLLYGSHKANPVNQLLIPKITSGKMYKMSLGQAGSP